MALISVHNVIGQYLPIISANQYISSAVVNSSYISGGYERKMLFILLAKRPNKIPLVNLYFVCSSVFRFGRKMSFLMSNLLNGIAGILVAVAPDYVSLLVFRTLYGFGVKGGWVAGYVLSKSNISPHSWDLQSSLLCHISSSVSYMKPSSLSVTELVGVEFRRTVGVLYQMFFSVGILLLPLLAYFITDWRWLQVVITVPYILFLSYYW